MTMTVEDWVKERAENCERLAAERAGADRNWWLEDASYFREILRRLSAPAKNTGENDGTE